MSFQAKSSEPSHLKPPKRAPNASILQLPNLVLRHVFLYLEAPVVIRKLPHDHLHEVFQGHDVLESDPRDLYNLLRTCRTLYENYEDIIQGKQLFSRFYLNISRPLQQEPQLIHQISSGKLQIFVVNPNRQPACEPTIEKDFKDPWLVHSKTSARYRQLNGNKDDMVAMLSRQCLKWVGTFIHWPSDNPEQSNDDPVLDLMVNLQQNFLGIINFHQYDSSTRFGSNPEEDICGVAGYGARRFWAMICHCKTDRFLVIHNARGTVWDCSFTCPRIAMVTSTYADARRTYEHALASGYFEVGVGH